MKNNSKTKRTENNRLNQINVLKGALRHLLMLFIFGFSFLAVANNTEVNKVDVIANVEDIQQTPEYCYSDTTADYRGGGSSGTVYIQGEPVNIRFTNGKSKIKDMGGYININPIYDMSRFNEFDYFQFEMTFAKPIKDLRMYFTDVTQFRYFNIYPSSSTEYLNLINDLVQRVGVNESGDLIWNSINTTKIVFSIADPNSRHVDLQRIAFNYFDCTPGSIPVVINASITGQDISCGLDGSLSVSLLGGLNPNNFTFALKKDSGSYQGISNYSNISVTDPGNYSVKITEKADPSNTKIVSKAISINTSNNVSVASISTTNATCSGQKGSLLFSVSGYNGSYEYQYKKLSDNWGASWVTSSSANVTINDLAMETYQVRVRQDGSQGCGISPTSQGVTIGLDAPNFTATLSKTDITCSQSTGSITVSNPSGGNGSYEFSIDGGRTWTADTLFNGLAGATYEVLMRNTGNSSCEITVGSIAVDYQDYEKEYFNATIGASFQNSMVGVIEGQSATITANGLVTLTNGSADQGNINYQWFLGDPDASGVALSNGGNYSGVNTKNLTINDSEKEFGKEFFVKVTTSKNTCIEGKASAGLERICDIIADVDVVDITCARLEGSIVVNPTKSVDYFYTLEKEGVTLFDKVAENSFSNLELGDYKIYVTEQRDTTCFIELEATVAYDSIDDVSASVLSKTKVSCKNPTAQLEVKGSGGNSGDLNYRIKEEDATVWTAWSSQTSYDGLLAGNYDIEVRDTNNVGCIIAIKTTIETEDKTIGAQVTPPAMVNCMVPETEILVNGIDGTGAYEYQIREVGQDWSDAWVSEGKFTKRVGEYEIKIRDANNALCEIVRPVEVIYNAEFDLSATPVKRDITCENSTGTIEVTGQAGGNGSFLYSKDGGNTWQEAPLFENLPRGSYHVMMKSKNDGECELDLGIQEILYLDYEVGYERALFKNSSIDHNGAKINVGEAEIKTGETLELAAAVILDANSITLPATSTENPQDFITYQWYLGNPADGGTELTDESTLNSKLSVKDIAKEMHGGQYFVVARHEKNNCISITASVMLVVDCLEVSAVVTANGDGINDELNVKCSGHYRIKNYKVFNRWGAIVHQQDVNPEEIDQAIFDGNSNHGIVISQSSGLPTGTYFYIIEFKDRKSEAGSFQLNR